MPATAGREARGGEKRTRSPEARSLAELDGLLRRFEKSRVKEQRELQKKGEATSLAGAVGVGTLQRDERKLAEMLFETFLDKSLSRDCQLTTGQVLENVGQRITASQKGLFKTLLQQMCVLTQAGAPSAPSTWSLKPHLRPEVAPGEQAV